MELISINAVKEGQVIARAVTTQNGAVLCPVGFTLSGSIIERLKNAGVESVVVEGGEASGPSAEERIALLKKRFAAVDDAVMLQLKAVIERRLSVMSIE
jgi:hypothetical protein